MRLGMGEVEAEIVRRDQAALLADMRAEAAAKRGVQQVGGAVVGADAVAAFGIDLLMDGVADLEFAGGDRRRERVELAERLRRILNFGRRSP